MSELTLTLIRGLPGSGKSTLAQQLVSAANNTLIHLEADMYFVNSEGEYHFQPALIKQAHQWCESQCLLALQQKQSVVVANTFVKQWEMNAYRQLAKQLGARLEIKICTGKYQSIHDVPTSTINKMRQQWQV
ncbi:ATPase AAA [Psychromonas marina]|uniref:ATPase AAA n=1 Tax=Psychromonas marina TaxID=88364 RepID=A0ABQ6DY35_9GAMM|nr:ATP-binding protein [Psychromonas marina]GLS89900.1 ATPase AAA [Psychromonas marina]